MMQHQILLIEDNPSISDMVIQYLSKENFHVSHASDGQEAINMFRDKTYDLILLDLMLPHVNGEEFLKLIREESTIPVLIISAKDSDVDKALGLGFGADDYITKPFSMIELSARIKSIIRRVYKYTSHTEDEDSDANLLSIHEVTLDSENRRAFKRNKELTLTSKEWEILKLFFANPKKVFTKEAIYRSVWCEEYYGDENIINVHIRRLREKVEDDPSNPKYIKTLWGIGYRIGAF